MRAPYQLLRAARVALDISHEDLAREAGVSERTLVRIEKPQNVSEESIARVQAALEARGVRFLPPLEGDGPGIRIPASALTIPTDRKKERDAEPHVIVDRGSRTAEARNTRLTGAVVRLNRHAI